MRANKIIITLVTGLVCNLLASATAFAAQPVPDPHRLQLQSTNAVVFDARTGEVLYSKNAEATAPIASITKLMTAMVVLDARLPMDEMLTISKDDIDRLKGTYSRLQIGTRQSRKEMLRLALMSSENRAASALGRNYPGGRNAFVAQMNRKAAALRMSHTHFDDTTGLSSHNLSSAGDLVKMTQAASQYALIREFTTTPERTVSFPQPRYSLGFVNTNRLVRAGSWDIELSKTGYTNEAGRCLVMKTRVGDRPMVMVLLNSQGKLTPVGDATRIKQWLETSNYPAIARRTTSA